MRDFLEREGGGRKGDKERGDLNFALLCSVVFGGMIGGLEWNQNISLELIPVLLLKILPVNYLFIFFFF